MATPEGMRMNRMRTGAVLGGLVLAIATGAYSLCVAQGQRPTLKEFLSSEKKLYSQVNEELLIRYFFNDKRGGTFVDVGSAHYKDGSTTYYLDKHLGWTGIAIDAISAYGPDYVTYRPRTKFFSYIVTDHGGGQETFFRLVGTEYVSSTSRAYVEDYAKKNTTGGTIEEVKVPTITLTQLLQENKVKKIDLLSMDIEDGEPPALAGFDIDRFQPALVCIEAHAEVADKILEYFRLHGYTRIDEYLPYDGQNWYFKPKK